MAIKGLVRTKTTAFTGVEIFKYFDGNREASFSCVIDPATVTADAAGKKVLKRGTLLCRITATDEWGPFASGAADGRQTLAAPGAKVTAVILSDDVELTVGPQEMGGYYAFCEFKSSALILNTATLSNMRAAFPTCLFE